MPNKPRCDECQWWSRINSIAGECRKSAPVVGDKRLGIFAVDSITATLVTGEMITQSEYFCVDFSRRFERDI